MIVAFFAKNFEVTLVRTLGSLLFLNIKLRFLSRDWGRARIKLRRRSIFLNILSFFVRFIFLNHRLLFFNTVLTHSSLLVNRIIWNIFSTSLTSFTFSHCTFMSFGLNISDILMTLFADTILNMDVISEFMALTTVSSHVSLFCEIVQTVQANLIAWLA